MDISKDYHPFLMGANNAMVKSISEATGARINIPPLSLNKDEITVAGEKECVAKAVSQIRKLLAELVSQQLWVSCVCVCVCVLQNSSVYVCESDYALHTCTKISSTTTFQTSHNYCPQHGWVCTVSREVQSNELYWGRAYGKRLLVEPSVCVCVCVH